MIAPGREYDRAAEVDSNYAETTAFAAVEVVGHVDLGDGLRDAGAPAERVRRTGQSAMRRRIETSWPNVAPEQHFTLDIRQHDRVGDLVERHIRMLRRDLRQVVRTCPLSMHGWVIHRIRGLGMNGRECCGAQNDERPDEESRYAHRTT